MTWIGTLFFLHIMTHMDIVSLKIVAREHTMKKSVVVLMGAKGQNIDTKDTL